MNRKTGRNARASSATNPARSASRMMPSHNAIKPIKPKAVPTTAELAQSKPPAATSFSRPFHPR
jgi:hypothetical protein